MTWRGGGTGATASPASGCSEKAVSRQPVSVSGAVAESTAAPSASASAENQTQVSGKRERVRGGSAPPAGAASAWSFITIAAIAIGITAERATFIFIIASPLAGLAMKATPASIPPSLQAGAARRVASTAPASSHAGGL